MIILRAEVEQIPNPSAPSSPQTLLSGLCASAKSNVAPLRSCRRQGNAPPVVKKSPLKKAISKFGVRAQHTVLMRITHASPSSQKSFLRKYFCEFIVAFDFQGRQEKRSVFCYKLRRKESRAFPQRNSICAEALLRKSEPMGAKLLPIPSARKTEHKAVGDCWVFLNLTRFLFVSSKRNL